MLPGRYWASKNAPRSSRVRARTVCAEPSVLAPKAVVGEERLVPELGRLIHGLVGVHEDLVEDHRALGRRCRSGRNAGSHMISERMSRPSSRCSASRRM